MFNFSLLHPSARPDKWREIYDQWLATADEPSQIQYILVGDQRWGFDKYNPGLSLRDQDHYLNLFPNRRCYVEAVNLAARYSHASTLIVIADDQHPCQGWDTAINRVIKDLYNREMDATFATPPPEYVIRINTGTPDEVKRNITVMPVVSRNRYQRLGYIFYPGYESMYADNDLSEHAQLDGVMVEAGDMLPEFPHRHPFFTDAQMDEQYAAQNRKEAYLTGMNLLNVRRATGFGTKTELQPQPQPSVRQKTMAVCLPGENFSGTYLSYLIENLCYLLPRFKVIPIIAYCSNVHITRGVMVDQVREISKSEPVDYVLWMDDDNLITAKHIERLITVLESYEHIDAVCGWCWINDRINHRYVTSNGTMDDDGLCTHTPEETFIQADGDLIKIEFTGFPLVLMRTHVLEVGKHPFAAIPKDRHPYGALSEDTSLWYRAKSQGLSLFVDRNCYVPHIKPQPDGPEPKPYGQLQPSLPAAETPNPVSV